MTGHNRIPTATGVKGWIALAAFTAVCFFAMCGALYLIGVPA
jgi:hypothetical protein